MPCRPSIPSTQLSDTGRLLELHTPDELAEVLAGIGAAIDAVGGSFTMRDATVVVAAARIGAA